MGQRTDALLDIGKTGTAFNLADYANGSVGVFNDTYQTGTNAKEAAQPPKKEN